MAKLSTSVRSSIRQFAYWVANRSVGHPLLTDVDYSCIFNGDPSAMEAAFSIFLNVLEVDDNGNVRNAKEAEHRAAQYIRRYCDPDYVVEPPFEDWEVDLPWEQPGPAVF